MKRWLIIIAVVVALISVLILTLPALAMGKVTNVPKQNNGNGLSANWAGYVVPTTATDEAVTAVSGSWTVPTVTGSGTVLSGWAWTVTAAAPSSKSEPSRITSTAGQNTLPG